MLRPMTTVMKVLAALEGMPAEPVPEIPRLKPEVVSEGIKLLTSMGLLEIQSDPEGNRFYRMTRKGKGFIKSSRPLM